VRAASRARLVWIANTDADVFKLGKNGPVCFLVSGRWFRATGLEGPWTFTTPDLPDDFKKIPLSHERSRVLASVPGTDARGAAAYGPSGARGVAEAYNPRTGASAASR